MKLSQHTIFGLLCVAVMALGVYHSQLQSLAPEESSPPASAAQATGTPAGSSSSTPTFTPKGPASGNERYTDMVVTIEVTDQANIVVTETITAMVRNQAINHGITRDIPLVRHHRWFTSVSDIDVEGATINGQAAPYFTTTSGHSAQIRIGDATKVLAPGLYTFGLTYRLDRQIGYFDGFDEIYWNVIGTAFDFTTEKASAVVTLPTGAPIRHMAAYTGTPSDSSNHGATFSKGANGTADFATTRALSPGEAFTIAVSWPKGFVPDPGWIARVIGNPYPILISLVTLIGTSIYFFVVWWQRGRDPQAGPEVPVYAPKLPPHAMRFLDKSGYDPTCLAVAIMEICAKGHARLEDNPDDPKTVVLWPILPGEAPYRRPLSIGEQKVHDILLGDQAAGTVLSKSNRSLLTAANDALETAVEDRFAEGFFDANVGFFAIGAVIILAGMMAATAWDAGSLALTEILNALLTGAAVVSILALLYTIGAALLRLLQRRQSRSWFTRLMSRVARWTWPLVILGIGSAGPTYLNDVGLLPASFLVASILILLVAIKVIPRRTGLGQLTMDEVAGTRLYLSVAEADRLKFENPPNRTPKHFSDLLPYAVALGVESAWTNQFVSAVGQAAAMAPTWYAGSHWHSGGWTSHSNPMTQGIASAVASQSQAIGGISGSSGGGFAGGGGGGGGSGGW